MSLTRNQLSSTGFDRSESPRWCAELQLGARCFPKGTDAELELGATILSPIDERVRIE